MVQSKLLSEIKKINSSGKSLTVELRKEDSSLVKILLAVLPITKKVTKLN